MTPDQQREFEEFVRTHARTLLVIAVGLTGHAQDGEDLLQVALTRVARRWGRGADEQPLAYTRTVLARLAVDRWRLRQRRPQTVLTGSIPEATAAVDTAYGIDDRLLAALRELPARQRAVVALRFLYDLSEQQTADTLGVSVGTVKSQGSKGLARLRTVFAIATADDEEVAR